MAWVQQVLSWGLPLEARARGELAVRRARLERKLKRRSS
jgi:hypothetical protein